jgi:hypothetical protein
MVKKFVTVMENQKENNQMRHSYGYKFRQKYPSETAEPTDESEPIGDTPELVFISVDFLVIRKQGLHKYNHQFVTFR